MKKILGLVILSLFAFVLVSCTEETTVATTAATTAATTVATTTAPLTYEIALVTDVGIASRTQFDNTDGSDALNTKFSFTSVLIAILPITAVDNANIADWLETTFALWKDTTGICDAGTLEFTSRLATPLALPFWEASIFKANPLVKSSEFAFKLIRLDKVAVSAFLNSALVSDLFNFKANWV